MLEKLGLGSKWLFNIEGPEGGKQVPKSFRNPSWNFQRAQSLSWREKEEVDWRKEEWQYQGLKLFLNGFEIQIKLYLNQGMKTLKILTELQDLPWGWFLSINTTNESFKPVYFLLFLDAKMLTTLQSTRVTRRKGCHITFCRWNQAHNSTLAHSQHPESTHKTVHASTCVWL